MATARLWKVFVMIFLLVSPCWSEHEGGPQTEHTERTCNDTWSWKVTGVIAGTVVAGVAAGAAVAAAPIVLPALGFTTAGIAAGSVAASAHSAIGIVQAGSVFAVLQSAGAVGGLSVTAGVTTVAAGGAAGGAAGAAAGTIADVLSGGNDSDGSKDREE